MNTLNRSPRRADSARWGESRWLPVVGGVMLNMALGTFYAMSAFMLPLEQEFGWTRAQTSWVVTIGIVMIAGWYVLAGLIHDRRGDRRDAVQSRVVPRQLHDLAHLVLRYCGVHSRRRRRLRLRRADVRRLQVVPGQARPGGGHDGRRIWRRIRRLRPGRFVADR